MNTETIIAVFLVSYGISGMTLSALLFFITGTGINPRLKRYVSLIFISSILCLTAIPLAGIYLIHILAMYVSIIIAMVFSVGFIGFMKNYLQREH